MYHDIENNDKYIHFLPSLVKVNLEGKNVEYQKILAFLVTEFKNYIETEHKSKEDEHYMVVPPIAHKAFVDVLHEKMKKISDNEYLFTINEADILDVKFQLKKIVELLDFLLDKPFTKNKNLRKNHEEDMVSAKTKGDILSNIMGYIMGYLEFKDSIIHEREMHNYIDEESFDEYEEMFNFMSFTELYTTIKEFALFMEDVSAFTSLDGLVSLADEENSYCVSGRTSVYLDTDNAKHRKLVQSILIEFQLYFTLSKEGETVNIDFHDFQFSSNDDNFIPDYLLESSVGEIILNAFEDQIAETIAVEYDYMQVVVNGEEESGKLSYKMNLDNCNFLNGLKDNRHSSEKREDIKLKVPTDYKTDSVMVSGAIKGELN